MRALVEAMQTLGLTQSLILTDTNADPIDVDGMSIEIRAAAQWLL